jgi:hypothetical protein
MADSGGYLGQQNLHRLVVELADLERLDGLLSPRSLAQGHLPQMPMTKSNNTIDASAYSGPRGGSQFEGYPLPYSKLDSAHRG